MGAGPYRGAMIDRAAHIRAEADRFGAVLATTDPGAPVPTCGDWTARDLLAHLTGVHRFWAKVIGDRVTGEDAMDVGDSAADLAVSRDELVPLRAAATSAMLAALTARDPAEAAWSWFPKDQSVGFTWRMQTHEATMHRVDAELTAGSPISPIPPPVADEGVSHVVDVMWNWVPDDAEIRRTGTIELRATDTETSWLLDTIRWSGHAWGTEFRDLATCVRAAPGSDPDAVVFGTAEQLDLLLWNRGGSEVARQGDDTVLAEFAAALAVGLD